MCVCRGRHGIDGDEFEVTLLRGGSSILLRRIAETCERARENVAELDRAKERLTNAEVLCDEIAAELHECGE